MKLRLEVLTGAQLAFDKKRLKSVMRAAGGEVAGVARKLIKASQGGSGHFYYRGGRRIESSAPGGAPRSITGALMRGIKVSAFRTGEGVAIRDREYYALALEAGAKGGGRRGGKGVTNKKAGPGTARVMAPRPFLSVALAQREASIGERVRQALLDDVAFRKVKP